jgi:hypothetical protein
MQNCTTRADGSRCERIIVGTESCNGCREHMVSEKVRNTTTVIVSFVDCGFL